MKQFFVVALTLALSVLNSLSTTHATNQSHEDIITWLNQQGMTTYTTVADYRPDDLITRGEVSKMIHFYAQSQGLQHDTNASCGFRDIFAYDDTLTPYIVSSCAYTLLKGHQSNFMPNNTLTQAQALTVIMRATHGQGDETQHPRYLDYFKHTQELGIVYPNEIDSVNTTPITRMELGERIHAASGFPAPREKINRATYIPTQPSTTTNTGPASPTVVTTNSTTTSNSSSASSTTTVKDETKLSGPYSRSLNHDTYQAYSDATLAYELSQGRRVILFFGSKTELLSRALDTSIKTSGVWGNVVVLLAEYETSSTLRTSRSVSSPHTLVYLDSNGSETLRTVKHDLQISQVITTMDNGFSASSNTKI